ncbi:MAG TPA: DUF2092 domain-containing protein [Burkholderiaceae bacterium]|nr:DUF2092 domain-containing protein [Burkholderiaceae bacterium]
MNPPLPRRRLLASRWPALSLCALIALASFAAGSAAQTADAPGVKPEARPAAKAARASPRAQPPLLIEPRAVELIKSSGAKLAAAKAMNFTAIVDEEYPSRLGPPLSYPVRYEVTLLRPDMLRVLQSGAGPANEYIFDGRTIAAYAPEVNLVALVESPPMLEAALKLAFDKAAIYFPFTDLLLSDPAAVWTERLIHAFYVGPSGAVGGVATESVAWATDALFVQMWVGSDDKLPRRLRAVYAADPLALRHDMVLLNWQLDANPPPETFASAKAQAAPRIDFASPVAVAPPAKAAKPVKPQAAAAKAN